jgi:hypothetical protein
MPTLVFGTVKVRPGHQDRFPIPSKECLISLDVFADQTAFCRCWRLGGSATVPVFTIRAGRIPHGGRLANP